MTRRTGSARASGPPTWTAVRVGRDVQSGALFVNGIVASDPRLPFGGTKRSGHGRELGAAGIRMFTNLRTIWLAAAD
jgi:succinate-semialdehyde dehydrogenase/glutarate-semialdehyde dehydrogenase